MGFIREHATGIVISVLIHGVIIAALIFGVMRFKSPPAPQPRQLAIEATVVDEKLVAAETRQQEAAERRRQEEERQERQRAEEVKRERETEEQRLEEIKQQRAAEEEKQRQLADEQQRAEELKRTREALETKRREEQEARAATERKQKADAVKAAAEKKQAAEAKQRADREAELKRQMADEERRAAMTSSGEYNEYKAKIQARIRRAWIQPPSAKAGLACTVYVTQVPGGDVVSARVGDCNGDDIVKQSIEAAVLRASPLPEPSDPAMFERNLVILFKPI